MLNKMFIIKIPLLLSLINLAFCYRLERQTDSQLNNTNNTTTSIKTANSKEEISSLFDNDDNYQSWREWPDRLFPRFHTITDQTKPTWTIVTKSKTIASTDYSPIYSSLAQLTPVPSLSSDLISPSPSSKLESSSFIPTVSNYEETNSNYLPPQSSIDILTSYPIQSSFNVDDLSTSDSFFTHTPFLMDSSSFTVSTSFIPQSTSFVHLSSDLNTNHYSNQFSSNIDRSEDFESSISSTKTDPQTTLSIHPSNTIDSSTDLIESTVHFNQTTPLPDTDPEQQYRNKMVILLKPLPQDMKNTSIEFETRLKKVFQLAFSRLNNKTENDLDVQLHDLDWTQYETNKSLTLIYSVKLNGKYLDKRTIFNLLKEVKDEEIQNFLNSNKIISKAEPFVQDDPTTSTVKPDINLGELIGKKLSDFGGQYFWIIVSLLIVLMLICCFYLGILVCWCKNKSKKTQFNHSIRKNLSQLSPDSLNSSDTLNTENFIRWRSKPDSKQNLNKRTKSLFKDDFKSSSLSKLGKRKEIGSSPSNEFEYISFSSDTTNSSLQRNGSMNKVNNIVRHHPYSPDYNRNLNYKRDLNKDYQQDYQQDYQDYQTQVIQKPNQLNQPNSIKLLISRGVQNNLLTDDYREYSNSSKKIPLEMPFNNSYYGNVSVLNLSKEKLIPLNQYTSDSSTTTSTTNNTINKDSKHDSLNSKHDLNSKLDNNSRPQSRSESRPQSRSSPKRLIKKEIIEEFETVTTTTTFKPNSQNSPKSNLNNLSNLEAANNDAQLNEQTKSIINAIRDELKKFHTTSPIHQSTHVQRLKRN